MAATRLTDSQKSELVARYREGAASQQLAQAYGCSINTVTRVVKATLTATDYEQLKQQRARGGSKPTQSKEAVPKAAAPEEPESQPELQLEPQPELEPVVVAAEIQRELAAEPDLALEAPVVLAIADADDFADDSDGDDCDGVDAEGDDADGDSDDFVEQFVAVPIALVGHSFQPVLCQPLGDAALPASVYMLVDKAVELQSKPRRQSRGSKKFQKRGEGSVM
jgi:transposase